MDIFSSMLIRVLAKILPSAIGYFYTEEKIAQGIKFQIRSDHEGMSFWGADMPRASAWVDILNLTPFTIEIDRMYGEFINGAGVADFFYLEPKVLKPSGEVQVLIATHMGANQANYIQNMMQYLDSTETGLYLKAVVKTSVRKQLVIKSIRTKNRRYVNFKQPTSEAVSN